MSCIVDSCLRVPAEQTTANTIEKKAAAALTANVSQAPISTIVISLSSFQRAVDGEVTGNCNTGGDFQFQMSRRGIGGAGRVRLPMANTYTPTHSMYMYKTHTTFFESVHSSAHEHHTCLHCKRPVDFLWDRRLPPDFLARTRLADSRTGGGW